MTKSFFIIAVLFLFVSCNQNCQSTNSSSTIQKAEKPLNAQDCPIPEEPNPIPDEPTGEVPPEAYLFEADVTLSKFDSADEEKVTRAIEIIKAVVRSQEFKDRVINYTYGGDKTYVDNDGLSNAEIYQKILDGSETLEPGIDHEMDLELELYYSWRSTVGYTYPDGMKIWMNTKFFDAYTPAEVAGNVFHEWTHKLGFSHASSYSVARESSVPYALGYLIEELGKKYE